MKKKNTTLIQDVDAALLAARGTRANGRPLKGRALHFKLKNEAESFLEFAG
jgi:hypothetical protein